MPKKTDGSIMYCFNQFFLGRGMLGYTGDIAVRQRGDRGYGNSFRPRILSRDPGCKLPVLAKCHVQQPGYRAYFRTLKL